MISTTATACPREESLAQLATDEAQLDAAALAQIEAHVESCLACHAALAEQREMRALVAFAPRPVLNRMQRAEMAAELLARADLADAAPRVEIAGGTPRIELAGASFDSSRIDSSRVPSHIDPSRIVDDSNDIAELVANAAQVSRRRRRFVLGGLAAAAAFALVIGAVRGREPSSQVVATGAPVASATSTGPDSSATRPSTAGTAAPSPSSVPGASSPMASSSVPGASSSIPGASSSVPGASYITVPGGAAPPTLVGEASPPSARAPATSPATSATPPLAPDVRVQGKSRTILGGSVETDRRRVIERGETWEAPPPSPAQLALTAFRDGWTALRDGRHGDAIAAFDRATDPVVAEDATYWAAVAAERLGDRPAAARRFADFVARFANSPRAPAARLAIDRLR